MAELRMTERTSSQHASIYWKLQNRLAGMLEGTRRCHLDNGAGSS